MCLSKTKRIIYVCDKDKREEPGRFVEVLTELSASEKNKGFT